MPPGTSAPSGALRSPRSRSSQPSSAGSSPPTTTPPPTHPPPTKPAAPTPPYLDLIGDVGAKRAFCGRGVKAEANPDLLAEARGRGADPAIHGKARDRLFNMRNEKRIASDVLETARIIERATGQKTR